MGTKTDPGNINCLAKAEDDEPIFVLLARDPLAPALVRLWAEARGLAAREQRDGDKADEAERVADDMERWAAEHPDHGFGARLRKYGTT